jgi:hypothetical protein
LVSKKICEFIRTFLDGDLIPAIILWKWQGNSFVIDGAHRLSALISWVQDDYGDGARSLTFYANRIPEEQKEIAKATRDLVKKKLGSYLDYKAAASNPDPSKPEVAARAKRLGARSARIQWVTGDPKKAEDAFFKINQEATPIDKTELRILRARNTPSAISARVILRAATGHKYWRDFLPEEQEKVVKKGISIHADLFTPPLNTPIKTLDLPVAGRSHAGSSLPLIFDLVNISNASQGEYGEANAMRSFASLQLSGQSHDWRFHCGNLRPSTSPSATYQGQLPSPQRSFRP